MFHRSCILYSFVLSTSFLLLTHCTQEKQSRHKAHYVKKTGKDKNSDDTVVQNVKTSVVEKPENFSACRGNERVFRTPYIKGDTLTLPVGYSGGCGSHEFAICWPEQNFSDETPPKVKLELWHHSNDTCEMMVNKEITFDLTPLKNSYKKKYKTEKGTLKIDAYKDLVDYSF